MVEQSWVWCVYMCMCMCVCACVSCSFILQSAGRSRAQLSRLLSHQDNHIKNTALHCAVEGHQIRAVQELLQYGASYRVQDYTVCARSIFGPKPR